MPVVFHPGTFRARFAANGRFENNQGRGYVTYRTHAAEGAKHAGYGILHPDLLGADGGGGGVRLTG
jgi:hypothetical protein